MDNLDGMMGSKFFRHAFRLHRLLFRQTACSLNTAGRVIMMMMIIIILYIYRALINALSAHIMHINLNIIVYACRAQYYEKQFT